MDKSVGALRLSLYEGKLHMKGKDRSPPKSSIEPITTVVPPQEQIHNHKVIVVT
jgi:hypothetical protein